MTDHITPQRRSWLMSRVGSKNTTPELTVRRAAHAAGLRFRLHRADLPGKPDMVFPRHRVVVFVHGCFWHRHRGCPKASTPKSRTEFWEAKFAANMHRDSLVVRQLRQLGWRVLIVWECQTKKPATLTKLLSKIPRPPKPRSARRLDIADSTAGTPRSGLPQDRSRGAGRPRALACRF